VAANSIASGPPSSDPIRATRSDPAASITASTSSIWSSSVGGVTIGSDRPAPLRSNEITREKAHMRVRNALIEGSSTSTSIWPIQVGTYMRSIGPSPTT
jgi:hypothetical protein